jgi:hypothetical protein
MLFDKNADRERAKELRSFSRETKDSILREELIALAARYDCGKKWEGRTRPKRTKI